jgi:hypothetical protein
MPSSTASATAAQDAVVTSLKQGQELALSGLNAWTELAGKTFPLPSLETLPFAAAVAESRQLIDASFGFASELLAIQKAFSDQVLDAVLPKKTK